MASGKKVFVVKMPKLQGESVVKGKAPSGGNNPPEVTAASGFVVGRAALAKQSSATLYKLLQLKNLPGRAKARSKASRVKMLQEIVTVEDLEAVGARVPAGPAPGNFTLQGPARQARDAPAKYGVRLHETVGSCDIHSKVLVAAVVSLDGTEVKRQFRNTGEGSEDLARLFLQHGVRHVAMESTAEYWLKPFWILCDSGLHVLVANPAQTRATQGDKTDWKDALRLAYALRDGRLKPSVTCTPEQYARKKLNRDAIKKTQQGGKARSRMDAMFNTFDAPEWVEDLLNSQRGLRVLSGCACMDGEADVEEVLATELATGKGKVTDPAELRRMASEMSAFLSRVGACPENRVRFGLHLEEYLMCKRMAAELRAKVLRQAASDAKFKEDLELLLSMPDVGIDTALTIAVELVDVSFFLRCKGASKWAGLAPRVNQSGFKKRVTGHIYKGGNKWLRWACWMVAKVAYAHAGNEGHPFGEFVSRLYKGGKKAYKVAVTAGARRVLTFAYHVLTQRRQFGEIWAELASEEAEANRARKVKELNKRLRQASTTDLLKCVATSLKQQCRHFCDADGALAKDIAAILGAAYHAADAVLL